MKVTKFTRSALAHRRDKRDRLRDGWEFVGEGGGMLWELSRGFRIGYIITSVQIAANGRGLWVKIEDQVAKDSGPRITPAMQAQIDQCRRMLREGANSQDIRDLGFSQGAIDAAINAVIEQESSE